VTNNIDNIIGISAFGLLIASLLVDGFCSRTWNTWYFTSGLKLFIKQIPVNHWHTTVPHRSRLEMMSNSVWLPSFTFKELGKLSYGFRETSYQFRLIGYAPLMHGRLTFDTFNGQVIVTGFANWYPLAFSFVWWGIHISFVISNWANGSRSFYLLIVLGASLFFTFLMGLSYWIQSSRFSKIASHAAEAWTRQYMRANDRA
jgi:hypothetical protein